MKRTEKKGFDCLAFKSRAQARINRETKDMTWEEEAHYLHERALRGPFSALAKKTTPESQFAVREKKARYRSKP